MTTEAATTKTNGDSGKKALDVLSSKLTRQLAVNMHACVHCGLCFDSCHYYLSTGDPKLTPAYKAEQFRSLYKRKYDWMGKLFPWWVNAKEPTAEELDKYVKVSKAIDDIEKQFEAMKKKGVDTSDVEVELNLGRDKLKQGLFTMAENYVESVKNRMKTM